MRAPPVMELLNVATGQPLPDDTNTRAHRLRLSTVAMLSALVLAALWGVLAGSAEPTLAFGNVLRVPLVVLLSALAAVPPGMLAWRLGRSGLRGSDLLLSFSVATFAGTLVMAALGPVVALYYHSSSWAGPVLALLSIGAALVVGLGVFLRRVAAVAPKSAPRAAVAGPVATFAVLQLAALLQLVALAGPMLPHHTAFDGGVDKLFQMR